VGLLFALLFSTVLIVEFDVRELLEARKELVGSPSGKPR
jgi:hypothetical protein